MTSDFTYDNTFIYFILVIILFYQNVSNLLHLIIEIEQEKDRKKCKSVWKKNEDKLMLWRDAQEK